MIIYIEKNMVIMKNDLKQLHVVTCCHSFFFFFAIGMCYFIIQTVIA